MTHTLRYQRPRLLDMDALRRDVAALGGGDVRTDDGFVYMDGELDDDLVQRLIDDNCRRACAELRDMPQGKAVKRMLELVVS